MVLGRKKKEQVTQDEVLKCQRVNLVPVSRASWLALAECHCYGCHFPSDTNLPALILRVVHNMIAESFTSQMPG